MICRAWCLVMGLGIRQVKEIGTKKVNEERLLGSTKMVDFISMNLLQCVG